MARVLRLPSLFLLALFGASAATIRVGILYNNASNLQHKLYLATWLGLRDTLPDSEPHIIDTSSKFASDSHLIVAWLLGNRTTRLVSLLDPPELLSVLDAYKRLVLNRFENGVSVKDTALVILLPRECIDLREYIVPGVNNGGSLFRVECLQMDVRGAARAIVHRAARVGVGQLLPITGTSGGGGGDTIAPDANDKSVQALYRTYKEIVYLSRAPFRLGHLQEGLKDLDAVLKTWTQTQTQSPLWPSKKKNNILGVLLLNREPELLTRVLALIQAHNATGFVYTFTQWDTHIALDKPPSSSMTSFGGRLYSLAYSGPISSIGATTGNSIRRKRLLAQLVEFIGPSQILLTAILAYDAAVRVVDPSRKLVSSGGDDSDLRQLSATSATRAPADGTFYGLSPIPIHELEATNTAILQQCAYIVEDVAEISKELRVVDYEVPTATLISAKDLKTLASSAEDKIQCRSGSHRARITASDPLSQMSTTYEFGYGDGAQLPPKYLFIPNQYGFTIDLSCEHQQDSEDEAALATSISIACTCTGKEGAASGVNCYRSEYKHRVQKRAADGNGMYGMSMGMSPSMSSAASTTQEPEPTTTEPAPTTTTTAAPFPPPPPLPDLRGILRAAKPFIGGCVGTQLGCATCVIVLTRSFPVLGVQPAICSGPCFTQTFGQCGGLLGRVASETTVICTELFRQGRIDAQTFLADAEWGRRVAVEAPMVLKGYRILATPLVSFMRQSSWVTDMVEMFAGPWAKHMQQLVGQHETESFTKSSNWVGEWVHWVGTPICGFVGQLATWLECVPLPASDPENSEQPMICPFNVLQCAFLICGILYLFVFRRRTTASN